jgi:hypothetical protein
MHTFINTYIYTNIHICYVHTHIYNIYIHTKHYIYTNKTLNIHTHKQNTTYTQTHKYVLYIRESGRLDTPGIFCSVYIKRTVRLLNFFFNVIPSPCSIMHLLFSNVLLYKDKFRSAHFRRTNSLHSKFIIGTSPVNGKLQTPCDAVRHLTSSTHYRGAKITTH